MLLIFKNYFKTKWDAFWCSFSFKNLAKYYPKVNLLIFFIKFKFGLIRFKLKKLIKISCFSLGKVEIKEITLSLSHSSSFCYLSLTLSLFLSMLWCSTMRGRRKRAASFAISMRCARPQLEIRHGGSSLPPKLALSLILARKKTNLGETIVSLKAICVLV